MGPWAAGRAHTRNATRESHGKPRAEGPRPGARTQQDKDTPQRGEDVHRPPGRSGLGRRRELHSQAGEDPAAAPDDALGLVPQIPEHGTSCGNTAFPSVIRTLRWRRHPEVPG